LSYALELRVTTRIKSRIFVNQKASFCVLDIFTFPEIISTQVILLVIDLEIIEAEFIVQCAGCLR